MASAIVTARPQHPANPDPTTASGAAVAPPSSSRPPSSGTHQRSFSLVPPPNLALVGRSNSSDAAGRDLAMSQPLSQPQSQPQSQPSSHQSFSNSQPQSQQPFSRHQLPDLPRKNVQEHPRIIYKVSHTIWGREVRPSRPGVLTPCFLGCLFRRRCIRDGGQ